MRLQNLSIENLDIPFKVSFQHSSATRASTEAVLVTAETENGIKGLGEGCPRSYVTGETLETAHQFFNRHITNLLKIEELSELKYWIKNNNSAIDKNPAAFCAVELALLSAMAKEADQTVEALVSLPELTGQFKYTGVLGSNNSESFQAQLKQYLDIGFDDYKVKIFGEIEIDQANIAAFRNITGNKPRVRLDANNLWSSADDAIAYIRTFDYPIFALEEPLGKRQYDDCRKIFEELDTRIILDESFINKADFGAIQDNSEPWIINIRISKMGGILRSLTIADKAEELGLPIIIGAQVGETSILTRAALTVANTHRYMLLAQEGAFGTYLLEQDLIDPPIMFGAQGLLSAGEIISNF